MVKLAICLAHVAQRPSECGSSAAAQACGAIERERLKLRFRTPKVAARRSNPNFARGLDA
ncbi:MAG TPA: hypothetical protein VHE55_00590 [Fimbriimonadaceae bacterium]|nr:hypothetical protein [Fimbriimonadaceae bacterium]